MREYGGSLGLQITFSNLSLNICYKSCLKPIHDFVNRHKEPLLSDKKTLHKLKKILLEISGGQ